MASSNDFQFEGVQGETLIKNPGTINGESFVLRDLTDCSVFLLDYTSEVEISNCKNCQLFIGPVDGPAILNSCSNCNVAVACQQFQAKGCSGCVFGLYCATGPTLSLCTDIKISCWSGAYAGLSAHFAAANLDPTKNQWNKVYDASAAQDQEPNFFIEEAPAEPWEVSIDGAVGPAENPVPTPTGGAPAPPAPAAPVPEVDALSAGLEHTTLDAPPPVPTPMENGGNPFGDTVEGAPHQAAAEAAAGYDVEPPATAAARDQLSERLAAQAREESEKRSAAQAAAARYLEEFYEKRNAARDQRIAEGRDELARRGSGESGPEGNSIWEKAISMVDFNAARPGGTDLSRFKSVLFACKERTAAAK